MGRRVSFPRSQFVFPCQFVARHLPTSAVRSHHTRPPLMAPRLSWSSLLPGLIAFAAVVLIAIGVIVFAGVGKIRGDTMRLYVRTNQARGVMKGSDVWLAGQKIGVVDEIGFGTPGGDTLARVVLALSVREKDAAQIRRDSHAQVRAGANIIGPIVVYISSGTPNSPAVRDGDTL